MLELMFGNVCRHGSHQISPPDTFNPEFANLSTRFCSAMADCFVIRAVLARPRGPSGAFRFGARTRSWRASSGIVALADEAGAAAGAVDDELLAAITFCGCMTLLPKRFSWICVAGCTDSVLIRGAA